MIWLLVLSAVATATAWALSSLRSEHRPIAWFLTLALTADAVRWPIQSLLTADRAPFTGALRVLAQAAAATLYVVLSVVQGGALWESSKQSI